MSQETQAPFWALLLITFLNLSKSFNFLGIQFTHPYNYRTGLVSLQGILEIFFVSHILKISKNIISAP